MVDVEADGGVIGVDGGAVLYSVDLYIIVRGIGH